MTNGIVFDIKEFALHDGPGIRTTVFLKGCPLRCSWCHNPEGQTAQPQTISGADGPRLAGVSYSAQDLADLLNRQGEMLRATEGGVTFSGGEPLAQATFLCEVIDRLDQLHVVLDTTGYAPTQTFERVARRCDLVHYDIKLVDAALHRRYTGCDNGLILANLRHLSEMNAPFVVRVPLIPGVTDMDENLKAIAALVDGLSGLVRVDLLPYNAVAGAKYESAGMVFAPDYDEDQPVNADTTPFEVRGIPVRVA